MSRSPVLPCLCSSFRRTSRALTQLYEQALRPLGLRASQFTILQVLSLAGEMSQGQLGEMLAMDSTTLTRTLEIMGRHGWIAERRGEAGENGGWGWLKPERRNSTVRCQSGKKFSHACAAKCGEEAWKNLMQLTNQVTDLATTQGDPL